MHPFSVLNSIFNLKATTILAFATNHPEFYLKCVDIIAKVLLTKNQYRL
jgi:hypothetical protein